MCKCPELGCPLLFLTFDDHIDTQVFEYDPEEEMSVIRDIRQIDLFPEQDK